MSNKNQAQIDEDNNSLMHEIEASNETIHDNCADNSCQACIGIGETPLCNKDKKRVAFLKEIRDMTERFEQERRLILCGEN